MAPAQRRAKLPSQNEWAKRNSHASPKCSGERQYSEFGTFIVEDGNSRMTYVMPIKNAEKPTPKTAKNPSEEDRVIQPLGCPAASKWVAILSGDPELSSTMETRTPTRHTNQRMTESLWTLTTAANMAQLTLRSIVQHLPRHGAERKGDGVGSLGQKVVRPGTAYL